MPRNVVLVTIDSLRADHVGAYGYGRETTPNIDDYAKAGHRFENAFAHACATRPSFPGILTASHGLMYGGFERLSTDRTLVSEVLAEAGYATGGFHSNLYLSEEFGYARGFDEFYDSREDPSLTTRLRQAVRSNLDSSGRLFNFLQTLYDRAERDMGVNIGSFHTPAADITDRALEWVQGTGGRPTFLWVHYMDPHHPFLPPEDYQVFSDVDRREGVRLRPKMVEDPSSVTDDELATLIDLYDDEIRYTDAEVGRLLSTLDDQWNDWSAVITADHGEEFKDHGDFTHQNLFYDETMHIPLVVYEANHGAADGVVHDEMVGHADIAPTIARWAGVESLPETFHGEPLQPLLEGRSADWHRDGVCGGWQDLPDGGRRFVYRTHDWKYIRDEVYDTERLFDLQADPNEQRNLLETEGGEPAVLDEMRARIDQYEDTVAATAVDVGHVDMDEAVKERLRRLGYAE